MSVEFLQFGAATVVFLVAALLWFRFVYKARRTGEGDGSSADRRSKDHRDREED